MKRYHVISRGLALGGIFTGALACGESAPPEQPRGLQLAVAPLQLPGIDVACYDILVDNGTDTVWSKGDPATKASAGDDDAVCSDQYGNGGGGDITYIGPCDATVDSTDTMGGVQNQVTIWVDGLYNGSSTADPSTLVAIESDDNSFWQNPCGATGCSLHFDCNENEDTLVEFNFTIMRDANQGFFDIAVNFEDVFCSAKYDTCYDVGTADERPMNLLHGPDGARDHTGVMGLACAGNPNTTDATLLHRSTVWVWCDGWEYYWTLDPSLGEGNVDEVNAIKGGLHDNAGECETNCENQLITASNTKGDWSQINEWCEAHVAADCTNPDYLLAQGYTGDTAQADCEDDQALCQAYIDQHYPAYLQCLEDCAPPTLRYATYWGTEELDCGTGEGSCNKVYWNIAINLEHLYDQGLRDCHAVTIASASTEGSGVFVDGEIATPNTWYPVIDHGQMDGSWNTGLPLVGATSIPCVDEPLNGDGSLVQTDYAQSGSFGLEDTSEATLGSGGPIVSNYWDRLCFTMTQDTAAPVGDPECLAWWCQQMERSLAGAELPSYCLD